MKITAACFFLMGSVTIFADAPKIVSASPNFWSTGINSSSQKTINLVFDRPMRQGFSAWLGTSSLLPESHLQSTNSEDGRSYTLAVSLAPAKVYVFALNEPSVAGVGFQSPRGVPLPTHYLVFQTAGVPKPEDVPPNVARILPANGSQQVDPAKTPSIAITFDQPMETKKHGLHLFENGKPVDISKVPFGYSTDGRTFSLPYSLRPGTQYRLELNSVSDIGFARANRIPLWPVQISFSTH
jgi:hypothetical protein